MSDSKFLIVVADKGWIYAGDVVRMGDFYRITNAVNIRRWGTTGGLGELALYGPTQTTELDPYNDLTLHILSTPGGLQDCTDAAIDKFRKARAKLIKNK